jgi:hypothetical protein
MFLQPDPYCARELHYYCTYRKKACGIDVLLRKTQAYPSSLVNSNRKVQVKDRNPTLHSDTIDQNIHRVRTYGHELA